LFVVFPARIKSFSDQWLAVPNGAGTAIATQASNSNIKTGGAHEKETSVNAVYPAGDGAWRVVGYICHEVIPDKNSAPISPRTSPSSPTFSSA
jgi:hypothetical protein